MTSTQHAEAPAAPADAQAPAPAPPAAPTTTPNQLHLHGGGISVSYFPEGFGPLPPGGAARLIYQDAQRTLSFAGGDVRTVEVPDLGTTVSVTLVKTVDLGATTFSLVVPRVLLSPQGGPVPVYTVGVATVHRSFLAGSGLGQREAYTVTRLAGTASRGILPL
jgi:hypothetical protein